MAFEPWANEEQTSEPQDAQVQDQAVEAQAQQQEQQVPENVTPEPEKEEPERKQSFSDHVPYSRFAEVNERLKQAEFILQQQAQQAQIAEQDKKKKDAPAYEDDPVEYLRQKNEMAEQELQEFKAWRQQQEYVAQAQQQRQQITNWYASQAKEYQEKTDDFPAAYSFLMERMSNLISPAATSEQEAMQAVEAWEMGVLQKAVNERKNPAELMYELAKKQGYQGKPPQNVTSLEEARMRTQTLGSSRAAGTEPEPPQERGLLEMLQAQSELGYR